LDVRAGERPLSGEELEIEMGPAPVAEMESDGRGSYPLAKRGQLGEVIRSG
jgi:hypothetical protein